MPQNLLAIHGVLGLVCAVGENGKILMFRGDLYRPCEVESPTTATLRGVWVNSPEDAWAVGDGELLRWDGRTWHRVLLNAKHEGFAAIWGDPADQSVWLGSKLSLMRYRTDGSGGTLVHTELAIRAIWGTGPDDVFYLCDERCLMHWKGTYINGEALPGDEDEEWNAIAGSGPADPVYFVGPSGIIMEYDRQRWWEVSSDTPAVLTGACCIDGDLYVVSEAGQVRCWDGMRWRTVAFSAFGALRGCCAVDGILWAVGDKGVVIQHQPDDGGRKE